MQTCECGITKKILYVLILVGALNWGLVGAFRFDLVAHLLGDMTIPARIVYILIGLAAVIKSFYLVISCRK